MTASANPLIPDATRISPAQAPGTGPGLDIRALIEALGRFGYDQERLLSVVGLHRADLENPDLRVSCAVYGAIVGRALEEGRITKLALKLAADTPFGATPLLDYLVLTADCVGDGFKQLGRYLRLVGVPTTFEFHEDEDPIRVLVEHPGFPFGIEYTLSLAVFHFRRETDDQLRFTMASFAHRPDDVSEFERLLACPVHAEALRSGLSVSREGWRLPLRRRDPILRGVLESHADGIAARLPTLTGVALEVRQAVASRVVGGDIRIGAVARQLTTTPRTLQRRLAAIGMSYQELVDSARREAAERLLGDPALVIAEVAYLLGYSEPAAFHHAFKRWTADTPHAYREAKRRHHQA